tara:strand:+ start:645 stop:959 length:315 start_codon:yes stop_codon:yes gene_type:complete
MTQLKVRWATPVAITRTYLYCEEIGNASPTFTPTRIRAVTFTIPAGETESNKIEVVPDTSSTHATAWLSPLEILRDVDDGVDGNWEPIKGRFGSALPGQKSTCS